MPALPPTLLPLLLPLAQAGGPEPERPVAAESRPAPEQRKANHLAGQTSPYLLQHVHNPVDWYPWGDEAFALAKQLNKPVFLSIGYASCHWCHVMERESFEDEGIAKLLNEGFVSIKVDREERPDVDEVYMKFITASTGHGGWPMSVFLTPEGKPFFGGTYFPPAARGGMPGFDDVLTRVAALWKDKEKDLRADGDKAAEWLRKSAAADFGGEVELLALLGKAAEESVEEADRQHGGWAPPPRFAPKFPHATELLFLLRHAAATGHDRARATAVAALDEMARGGIHDQLAGGFARYSVDREWTVPHFEKMLYDNAQLAVAYLEAWQATGDARHREVCERTLRYMQREMLSPEGGFWSSTDADSEGVEGKFFVWTPATLAAVLGDGPDLSLARRCFGVTEAGNFEGETVLTDRVGLATLAAELGETEAAVGARVDAIRARLLAARAKRVAPALDDKVLSSWNGLALSAFARAARALGDAGFLATAQRNAAFLCAQMRDEGGRLLRTRRDGRSRIPAFLEDHAFVTQGLLDLFEADGDPRWLEAALALHRELGRFAREGGGWYATPKDGEDLLFRSSSIQESSLPSEQGVAALNAVRLGLMAGDPKLVDEGRACLKAYGKLLEQIPRASCQMLLVAQFLVGRPAELYLCGEPGDAERDRIAAALARRYPLDHVLVPVTKANGEAVARLLPAADGKDAIDGRTTAWICFEGLCKAPVGDLAGVEEALRPAPKKAQGARREGGTGGGRE